AAILFRTGVSFAEDGEVQIAVAIHDQLADPRQHLLHGFQVTAAAGDLGRFAVLGGDLGETGSVAGGLVALSFAIGLSLVQHVLPLAAGFRDEVGRVAFRIADDAGGVRTRTGNVAEGVGRFRRRSGAFDVDRRERHTRSILVELLLRSGPDFVLNGRFFRGED